MASSEQYKREIMQDLARGNVESLDDTSAETQQEYENFDDFAQRSSTEERRRLFGRSLHPEKISTAEMEPELQKAISEIEPKERDDIAREFFKELKERSLDERDLERQLGLSTHHASRMNADDVSKLASFVYHNHPDIFQKVMADRPGLLKFLSNPLVGAILGVVAAKWLKNRH